MDLHLRIDADLAGTIELDLRATNDTRDTVPYLDCRHLTYDEIGGEGFNARRHRWRRTFKKEALNELQRLLPPGPLATPANAPAGIDGTRFTLTIGRGAAAVEYSWSSCLPGEWECLGEIVRLLVTTAGIAANVDLPRDRPRGRTDTG